MKRLLLLLTISTASCQKAATDAESPDTATTEPTDGVISAVPTPAIDSTGGGGGGGGGTIAPVIDEASGSGSGSGSSDPTGATVVVTPSVTHASLAPSAAQTIAVGDTVAFTLAADAGFVRPDTVTGTCPAGSWAGAIYTTGTITEDCTVIFAANVGHYLYLSGQSPDSGMTKVSHLRLNPAMDDTYETAAAVGSLNGGYSIRDPAGNTFVYDSLQTIYKVAADGTQSMYATSNLIYMAQEMRLDAAGNLYLVNGYVHSTTPSAPTNWAVVKITPNGSTGTAAGFISGTDGLGSMLNPYDVAFDHNGIIYLSDQGLHNIRRYDATGTLINFFKIGVPGAASMAFDHDGNLLVANFGNPLGISKISADGATTTTVATFSTDFPLHMALDPVSGTLYVLGSNDWTNPSLLKVTPDGTVTHIDAAVTGAFNVWALGWY